MNKAYTLISKSYHVEVWTNAEALIDDLNINQHIDYYLIAGEEKVLVRPALSLLVGLLRNKTAIYCYSKNPEETLEHWNYKVEIHDLF